MRAEEHKRVWADNLKNEVQHWRWWLTTEQEPIRTHRRLRVDPHRRIPECFLGCSRILDVGSGPLPRIGLFNNDGSPIDVIAVDPLARSYNVLLDEVGIDAQVRPVECPAETLTALFAERAFDGVHCHNALDHSYDPMTGLREILRVLKVGGVSYILSMCNEGEANRYSGLHQWNFDVQQERLVLWRDDYRSDVGHELSSAATLESLTTTEREDGRTHLEAVFRKKA